MRRQICRHVLEMRTSSVLPPSILQHLRLVRYLSDSIHMLWIGAEASASVTLESVLHGGHHVDTNLGKNTDHLLLVKSADQLVRHIVAAPFAAVTTRSRAGSIRLQTYSPTVLLGSCRRPYAAAHSVHAADSIANSHRVFFPMERLVRIVGNPPARRWAAAQWGAALSLLQQPDTARAACYCSLASGNVPGSCNTCRGCNGAAAPQHPPYVATARQLLHTHPLAALAGGTTQVNAFVSCWAMSCYRSRNHDQQAQEVSWLKVIMLSAGCSAPAPCRQRADPNILVRDAAVGGAAVDQPRSGRRSAAGGAAAAAAGRSGAAARFYISKASTAGGLLRGCSCYTMPDAITLYVRHSSQCPATAASAMALSGCQAAVT